VLQCIVVQWFQVPKITPQTNIKKMFCYHKHVKLINNKFLTSNQKNMHTYNTAD